MTLMLLAGRDGRVAEAPVLGWLKRRYHRAVDWSLRHPGSIAGAAALICGAAVLTVPFFGATFLPEFREGHYLIHMSAVPGTSLDESLRLGQRVTAALHADERVRSVAQRIGRAELSEDTWGTHYTEFEVSLVPLAGRAAETVEHDLRGLLAGFPGVNFAIRGFLSERIEETLTGSTAELVVRVFGDDLDSLDAAARTVAEALASVPGAIDVQHDPPAVTPEVTVRLRPYDVAAAGLRPDEVLAAVEAATRGVTVAHLFEGNRSTGVVVTLLPERRSRPEDLRALPVISDAGRLIELHQVADVARTTGRSLIMHLGTRRVQTVTANVSGDDTEGVTRAIEGRLAARSGLPADAPDADVRAAALRLGLGEDQADAVLGRGDPVAAGTALARVQGGER
jgi:Cu/Ag efflux pump CusA